MQLTMARQSAIRTHGSQSRRLAVTQDKIADMAITQTQRNFVAWCPIPDVGSLAEIVHSLYYLPQNFMLMIPRVIADEANILSMLTGSSIIEQVQIYENEGSSQDEPLLLADAVIRVGAGESLNIAPVRFAVPSAEDGVTAKQSPEAVASALLNIARDF